MSSQNGDVQWFILIKESVTTFLEHVMETNSKQHNIMKHYYIN